MCNLCPEHQVKSCYIMSTAILAIPRLKQISYDGVPMTKDKTDAVMQQCMVIV